MIKCRVVGPNHEICQDTCPTSLDSDFKRFWVSRQLGRCDNAVVAKDGDKVIGFFRFDVCGGTLYGFGTYILSEYRNLGLAKKLWNRAIKNQKPHSIEVYLTSRSAVKLLRSLEASHKDIDFCIFENM